MSSKKQRKILFWAYFWKTFQFISPIVIVFGKVGMIIFPLCWVTCGVYFLLGVKFKWQSAHCIAQTLRNHKSERYREMNVRNYAWSDKEKGNLIAFGIIDIVAALFLLYGFSLTF